MTFRILVLDPIAQEGFDLLNAEPGFEYEVRVGLKGPELRSSLNEFDGAIVRSGVKITAESLEGNKRLRAIVRAGVGTDNIDKNAATRLGIVVMNTPAGNTLSTAEHAFALMLGLSRSIAPAYQSLCNGKWDRKLFMGAQLADGVTDGLAGPQQWRTAPLIGLRHLRAYLHDGRAETIEDAILAHGTTDSEGAEVTRAFLELDADDRDALLAFVEVL